MTTLPPEIWLCVFHHATYVPGTLVPEIYGQASHIGPIYTKACNSALRETLVTTRALVRVCKQWWHLAIPYLYRSVYIGRARCLSSLSSTLVRSAAGKGTLVGARPLGEYTQRLDIAIRDHAENADAESDSVATLLAYIPHLAVVSFAITVSYAGDDLADNILKALQHSASSLRVLDWSSFRLQPPPFRIVDLLAKCTQLRVLNYPRLIWSKELEYGGIPPTLTTLRLRALIPARIATSYNIVRRPGPTGLQELILDLNRDLHYWEDLLNIYSDQLVSVQFYVPSHLPINIDSHLQLLTRTCPRLPRLTLTSECLCSLICPNPVFPPITYLGLRATRTQMLKTDFEKLFKFLEGLRSIVPSLKVVQLLNEHNVQCLFKAHTKFAVRALQPFVVASPFRVEDGDGVLLTGLMNPVSGGCAWTNPLGV